MEENKRINNLFEIAYQSYEKNNLEKAENLFKKILKIDPNHYKSIFLYGSLCLKKKKFELAKKLFLQVIELFPNDANAYNNLGNVLKELGDIKGAINCYKKTIEIYPNHPSPLHNLGLLFHNQAEYEQAKKFYIQTLKLNPNHANAHNNYGLVLQELGDYQEAKSSFQKAIKIQPIHSKAYNNLANVQKKLGELSEAKKSYYNAIKYDPNNLETFYQLVELDQKALNTKNKKKIYKIIKENNLNKINNAYGKILLSKYEYAKKNYKQELKYLIDGHQDYFKSRSDFFKHDINYWFKELPLLKEKLNLIKTKDNYTNIKPIFIIGVPRCGSTLVEKIIASSNNYIPIGEETNIFNSTISNYFTNSNQDNLHLKILEKYDQKKLIQKKSDYIFTDKSLENFFFIKIIIDIFPEAKFINCSRSNISSIVSILKNNMTELAWAHNISNIFKYFDFYYKNIAQHKNFFSKHIYDLNFENLTLEPKQETKKLFQFCNLDWNDKCLEFYKRKDIVSKTASNVQIRNKIYKNIANRYLPYKKLLKKYGNKYSWFDKK